MLIRTDYPSIRKAMRPGDVIAFGGKGHFSEVIKWATRAATSHVGIVLQSKIIHDGSVQDGFLNQIIESTSLNGFSGVAINRVSDRLSAYDGEVWWLPLSDEVRAKMDHKKFYNFLLHQEGKPYDTPQAVYAGLDALDRTAGLTHNQEDFGKFFCSELAAAGLEEAGAIPHVNASEITPIDLCMFRIYRQDYYQIKGPEKPIRGFNTLDPAGWGE